MLVVEIAKYLHNQGIGTFDETGVEGDIFIGLLPQAPTSCIAINPTGGYMVTTSQHVDEPTIQILVRGSLNPLDSYNRAQQILDTLNGFHNDRFTPDGQFIVNCVAIQSAPFGFRDNNGNYIHTINFLIDTMNYNRRNL